MAAKLEGQISGDSSGFVSASKKAQKSLGKLEKKGEQTGSKIGKAFKGIAGGLATIAKGAGVAGAALGAVGVGAVASFAKFEKKFAQVTTLFDATPKKIDKLQKDLRALSVTMGVDVLEATEAAYQAISAGQQPGDVIKFLDASFKGAAAGAATATESVDAFTTVMNAFKGQNIDVAKASDVLFATIKAGKTTMSELSASLGQVAPIAASAGVRFEDMAAAMAAVTASGLNTAETSTAIKASIVGILKPSASAAKALESIGVSSESLKDPTLGLGDAIEKVRNAIQNNNRSLVEFFPNVRALNAVSILAGDGFDKFKETIDLTRNSVGEADKAFGKVQNTIAFKFSSIVEGAKESFRSLGESLAPVAALLLGEFSGAVSGIRSRMQQFAMFMADNFEETKAAVMVFVDAGKAAMVEFADALGFNMTSMGDTFSSVLAFVTKNREAIIKTVGRIARVAAATGKLAVEWGKKVTRFFGAFTSAIGGFFGFLAANAGTFRDRFAGAATAVESHGLAVKMGFQSIAAGLLKVAEAALLGLRKLIEGAAAIASLVGKEGLAKDLDDAAASVAAWERIAADAFTEVAKDAKATASSLADVEGRYEAIRAGVGDLTTATLELASAEAKVTAELTKQTERAAELGRTRTRNAKEQEIRQKKAAGGGKRKQSSRRRGGGRRGFLQLGIVRGQRGAGFPGMSGAAGGFGTAGATAGQGGGSGQFGGMVSGPGGGGGGGGGGGQDGAMQALAQLFQRFRSLAKEASDDPEMAATFETLKGKIKDLAKTIGTDAFGPAFLRMKEEITKGLVGLTTPQEFTAAVAKTQALFEQTGEAIKKADLPGSFGKLRRKFIALGDATGPEAQGRFQALADKMRDLGRKAEDPAAAKLDTLAEAMQKAADKAGKAGLAGELEAAGAAMDSLKESTQGVASSARRGGGGGGQGRRSITGRPISDSGQIASRKLGGYLDRTGKYLGHRGEFVIRRRAAMALGPAMLRKLNRGVEVNNTINASDSSSMGTRAQIREMLPELRRQTKLGIRQGGPF